ncbi:MAG TPA: MATE family efflux transporter [Thermoanaerobaculia bacterium]|jgi:MATE family multidrug resistance protein|nr:MATE family efflux transporter [Thermoanaerobaculia bacterium]
MTRLRSLRTELAAASRLAAPVVLVQLGMMLMGVVDTMMLGHLSARALAAGALGHIVTITCLMLGYGILSALDPLVSQAYGADDHEALGGHLQRGFVLAGVLTVPFVTGLLDVEPLLRALGQPAAVSGDAADYTRAILWGGLPYFLFIVLRQALQAMSVVRPAAVAIVLGNGVNAGLNWILIFGHLGAPALGVRGSALSTSAARWVMFLYLLAASRRTLAPWWRGFTAEAAALRSYLVMLRIGVPIGLHNSVELLIFDVTAVLIGRMGVAALAGHQIALNLASLSFMVPLGISGAAATRVGNAIGRGDMPGARRAAAACLMLGAGAMLVFALLFATLPGPLARLYTVDPAVIAVVVSLLPIAALFQVFDGLQVVSSGALRGSADTTVPAVVALIGYWVIGIPIGWALAFRAGLGPAGLWWGITVGLVVVAVLLVARIAMRFRGTVARVGSPHPALSQERTRP